MSRILLIDDDTELTGMLSDYLGAEGFTVDAVYDGESGVAAALTAQYDVVVLDVMLPRLNGVEVLRQIRQQSRIPVLMLTARGDDVDRIVGLELGADDYLPKPCNPRELAARLRAILRRTHEVDAGEQRTVGRITLDPARRVACWGEQRLELTSTEFNILESLMRHAGQVVSKADLSDEALGRELERYDRGLDMHVSNLRRKLGSLSDGRSPIQTVRGVGYQLLQDD
ncbi:response regulator transcription factor [Thiohalophilus thiocyanatoxydans]|uniref:Two-component system OmpR family response regulator n=1 Tax=Thiohalophilus thiocyanatoxydans TaxID=381308 RepID=A0A4R8IIM7_9GAMM|nr:response regulator transcription factor [Thiohalophilus thiocyanatoxydans]TDY00522.1 two-component system OmpR family response regulator [Thiohalophilus thiocyanatoxydans]